MSPLLTETFDALGMVQDNACTVVLSHRTVDLPKQIVG